MSTKTLHHKDNVADAPGQTRLDPASSRTLLNSKGQCLAKLMGRKALTECHLIGLAAAALSDRGAQVSMIDRDWKNRYLPDTTVYPLSKIDDEEELQVFAVKGDIIPFDG